MRFTPDGARGYLGGAFFEVEPARAEEIIRARHAELLAQGIYLFRAESYPGLEKPDVPGLLSTRNRYAVVHAMQTNGENAEVRTWDIIAWLKRLQRIQSFHLTGIGADFLEGSFTEPVRDPFQIAAALMQISPEALATPLLQDQPDPTIGDLAVSIAQTRQFILWWD